MKKFILVTMMMLPLTSEAGPLSKLLGKGSVESTAGKSALSRAIRGIEDSEVSLYYNVLPAAAGITLKKKGSNLTTENLAYAIDNAFKRLPFVGSSELSNWKNAITAFSIKNADGSELAAQVTRLKGAGNIREVDLYLHGMDESLAREAVSMVNNGSGRIYANLEAIHMERVLMDSATGRARKVHFVRFYLDKRKIDGDELRAIGRISEHINNSHLARGIRTSAPILSRKSVR